MRIIPASKEELKIEAAQSAPNLSTQDGAVPSYDSPRTIILHFIPLHFESRHVLPAFHTPLRSLA
jgi:hypothetical protein